MFKLEIATGLFTYTDISLDAAHDDHQSVVTMTTGTDVLEVSSTDDGTDCRHESACKQEAYTDCDPSIDRQLEKERYGKQKYHDIQENAE